MIGLRFIDDACSDSVIKNRRETPSDTVRDEEKGVANPRHEFPYRGQVLKYQSVLACLG